MSDNIAALREAEKAARQAYGEARSQYGADDQRTKLAQEKMIRARNALNAARQRTDRSN